MNQMITNTSMLKAMETLKMSQTELAKKIDAHPTSVSKWLRGVRPHKSTIRRLESVFGTRARYWWDSLAIEGNVKAEELNQQGDIQVGSILKCIDDTGVKGIPNIGLTKGKLYRVERMGVTRPNPLVYVKDDYGLIIAFMESRFTLAKTVDVTTSSLDDHVLIEFIKKHIVDELEERDERMYKKVIERLELLSTIKEQIG